MSIKSDFVETCESIRNQDPKKFDDILKLSPQMIDSLFIQKIDHPLFINKQFMRHLISSLMNIPYIPKEFFEKYDTSFCQKYKNEIIESLTNANSDLDDFIDDVEKHPVPVDYNKKFDFYISKTGSERKIQKISDILGINPALLNKYKTFYTVKKTSVNYTDKEIIDYIKEILKDKKDISEVIKEVLEITNCGLSRICRLTGMKGYWLNENIGIQERSIKKIAGVLGVDVALLLKFKRNGEEESEPQFLDFTGGDEPDEDNDFMKHFANIEEPSIIKTPVDNFINDQNKIKELDEKLYIDLFKKLIDAQKLKIVSIMNEMIKEYETH